MRLLARLNNSIGRGLLTDDGANNRAGHRRPLPPRAR